MTKTFEHDYNWYDGVGHPLTGVPRPVPYDEPNLGTFTTGILVSNKYFIGVAPQAQYIACKANNLQGIDTPEWMLKCLEFMYAPHDLNGENPSLERRPHIVYMQYCVSCFKDYHYSAMYEAITKVRIELDCSE